LATLREFCPRSIDGYAKANRQKPSSIANRQSILRLYLIPALGDKPLDEIGTEDVQQLKTTLGVKSPKKVNNVLTVLNTLLRTVADWGVIGSVACTIRLVRVTEAKAAFHDFDACKRLVEAARRSDQNTLLAVLLGGEAGLSYGEIMALEWPDVDLVSRRLCVERSEWKGLVTATKGGRIRHVPLTLRLETALRDARHLRGRRVLCDERGSPLSQKEVQGLVRRVAERAGGAVRSSHPAAHVLFALGYARCSGEGDSGTGWASGPVDPPALHAPEPGSVGFRDPVARQPWRNRGAAGTGTT